MLCILSSRCSSSKILFTVYLDITDLSIIIFLVRFLFVLIISNISALKSFSYNIYLTSLYPKLIFFYFMLIHKVSDSICCNSKCKAVVCGKFNHLYTPSVFNYLNYMLFSFLKNWRVKEFSRF